jgi:hypothetical protein
MGPTTRDSMPCCVGHLGKSFPFSIRSLSPLAYMGFNLACIVQHFLHGSTILGRGASPLVLSESRPVATRCRRAHLSPHSPLVLKWTNRQKSMNTQTT